MNGFQQALKILPSHLSTELSKYGNCNVEEIRIRQGRAPSILINGNETSFAEHLISPLDIKRIIEIATGASFHMAEQTLTEGFINCRGLRIGVCGCVNTQRGNLHSFRTFTSLAIRIPKEFKGICDELLEGIYKSGFKSSLIISAPGGGKTTALRELCRCLSNRGKRLSVVDERNELFADDGSGNGFDLGKHSDVLSGVPKAEGSIMLLRAMNPEIIAMDEITKNCDIDAIAQAAGCGVGLLSTAHASSKDELYSRPLYKRLVDLNIFKYLITISGHGCSRVYTAERI